MVVISDSRPVVVRLETTRAVSIDAHLLRADGTHPPRLLLDLPGTTLSQRTPHRVQGAGPVLLARTGQFSPSIARVVLELREPPPPYVIQAHESVVTVSLGDATMSGSVQRIPDPSCSGIHGTAESPVAQKPPPVAIPSFRRLSWAGQGAPMMFLDLDPLLSARRSAR